MGAFGSNPSPGIVSGEIWACALLPPLCRRRGDDQPQGPGSGAPAPLAPPFPQVWGSSPLPLPLEAQDSSPWRGGGLVLEEQEGAYKEHVGLI